MNRTIATSGVQLKWITVVAGVFCMAMATGAPAQEGEGVCKEDAARLCKDVTPGGCAIGKCLKEHLSDLSPACKERIKAKTKEKEKELKNACSDDAQRLCPGMKAGGGHILECLKLHEDQLTADCKEVVQKRKGGM